MFPGCRYLNTKHISPIKHTHAHTRTHTTTCVHASIKKKKIKLQSKYVEASGPSSMREQLCRLRKYHEPGFQLWEDPKAPGDQDCVPRGQWRAAAQFQGAPRSLRDESFSSLALVVPKFSVGLGFWLLRSQQSLQDGIVYFSGPGVNLRPGESSHNT